MRGEARGGPVRARLEDPAAAKRSDHDQRTRPLSQLDLFDAAARRDAGAQAAADSIHTTARVAVEGIIRRLAASREPFTADDVRDELGEGVAEIAAKGLGGLFITAARRGEIRGLGYRPARHTAAACRPVRVWVGAGDTS